MLKFLTYYAHYYAHAKDLYLKFDCFIRVYSQNLNVVTSIRAYLKFHTLYRCTNNNHSGYSIRVY